MITIISSTSRQGSSSYKLALYYQKKLSEKGVEAGILSMMELPGNLVETSIQGKTNPEFQQIQERVSTTEKFLFIIPEYNGSFPGILKFFIDTCAFPQSFYEKKAALVGLSSGKYGNIRGVDHFTGVCHYMHLNVMPLKLHIANIRAEFNETGDLFKDDTLKFTNEQIDKFIKY
jgi:chromate reductase, NAD(P)H dehydrogenase (quinone)